MSRHRSRPPVKGPEGAEPSYGCRGRLKGVWQAVWQADLDSLPRGRRWIIRWIRLTYAVGRDLASGQLSLRATSLVYTTLLSLVPLLAVSFSVLKALGVHNQIEPSLRNFLAPLGERGAEISSRIIGFVENISVGVLGSVGLALLLYTVVSLIQKIEEAFNYVWHVKRLRSLGQRFSGYLSVILIGPVLVFSAMGTTASLMATDVAQRLVAIEPLGELVDVATQLLPYLLIIAAFAFVYAFVPNTSVRLRSAWVGALLAGVLWQSVGGAFASFIVNSTKYTAIYSGLAILVVFMIWVYLAWLILLVGASIAFYHQHPEYVMLRSREMRLSSRVQEALGLTVMFLVADSHYRGGSPWGAEDLAEHVGLPLDAVQHILGGLERHGLLIRAGDGPAVFVPGVAPESVLLKDLMNTIRTMDEDADPASATVALTEPACGIVQTVQRGVGDSLANRTLRDWVMAEHARDGEPGKGATAGD